MRKIELPEGFAIIPFHDDYAINQQGCIYQISTRRYITVDDEHVSLSDVYIIDDEPLDIGTMIGLTFLGPAKNARVIDTGVKIKSKQYDYIFDTIEPLVNGNVKYGGEEYRRIPGFSNYVVSECGTVMCTVGHKAVYHWRTPNLYEYVMLNSDTGPQAKIHVNRLVYRVYVGQIPDGLIVDHKDSRTYNNDYRNLQCISQYENIARSFTEGEKTKLMYMSDDVVDGICRMMERGMRRIDIAYAMNITDPREKQYLSTLITGLRDGSRRSIIASKYDFSKYDKAVSDNVIRVPMPIQMQIAQLGREGYNLNRISQRYPAIESQTIYRICKLFDIELSKKALTPAEVDGIARYIEVNGTSNAKRRFGLSENTLSQISAGRYFNLRPRGFRVPKDEYRVKRLDAEIIKQIDERILRGDSGADIAKDAGCSSAYIVKRKRKLGVQIGYGLGPEKSKEIADLLNSREYDANELAEKYGVTNVTIRNIWHKYYPGAEYPKKKT